MLGVNNHATDREEHYNKRLLIQIVNSAGHSTCTSRSQRKLSRATAMTYNMKDKDWGMANQLHYIWTLMVAPASAEKTMLLSFKDDCARLSRKRLSNGSPGSGKTILSNSSRMALSAS